MQVGDLVRFRPDLKWLSHNDHIGILMKFNTPEGHWVDVFWPGVDKGLLGVYLARELEVISESR